MSCQNVCSGSKNVMNTESSSRSPALSWALSLSQAGTHSTHRARGDPASMGSSPQAALIAVATMPLQAMPEMPLHSIPGSGVRWVVKHRDMNRVGGWLLCWYFFGSLAVPPSSGTGRVQPRSFHL